MVKAPILLISTGQAVLVIADVTDGDLSGGNPGAFDRASYTSNAHALDGFSEQQHLDAFAAVGFTLLVVPKPSAILLLRFAGLGLLHRRR